MRHARAKTSRSREEVVIGCTGTTGGLRKLAVSGWLLTVLREIARACRVKRPLGAAGSGAEGEGLTAVVLV